MVARADDNHFDSYEPLLLLIGRRFGRFRVSAGSLASMTVQFTVTCPVEYPGEWPPKDQSSSGMSGRKTGEYAAGEYAGESP